MLPLLIAGGIGLTQAVAPLIPTKADKERRRRMEELRAGGGMSDAEARSMAEDLMGNVKRSDRDNRSDQASLLAATGETSGGALAASQRRVSEASASSADAVSRTVERADAAQRDRDAQELLALEGQQVARAKDKRDGVMAGLSSVAGAAGAHIASEVQPKMALVDVMKDAGIAGKDARAFMQAAGGTEQGLDELFQKLTSGNTAGVPPEVLELWQRYN